MISNITMKVKDLIDELKKLDENAEINVWNRKEYAEGNYEIDKNCIRLVDEYNGYVFDIAQ